MGKPNKRQGSRERVRGGAGSKRRRGLGGNTQKMGGTKNKFHVFFFKSDTDQTHLLRSTVVTLKTTPFSHRIMKSL